MKKEDLFKMQKCPKCGKRFIIQDTSQYTYKIKRANGYKYYCSWTCYRKNKTYKSAKAEKEL